MATMLAFITPRPTGSTFIALHVPSSLRYPHALRRNATRLPPRCPHTPVWRCAVADETAAAAARAANQLDRFSLRGKTAVVTGGHRGVGRAISLGMARAQAAMVIVIDRKGPADSDVPAELKALGCRHAALRCDLGDADAVARVGREALRLASEAAAPSDEAGATPHAGGVDLLVNNAGVASLSPLESFDSNTWDRILDVNLRGAFVLSREIAGADGGMLQRGHGVIVNISSVAGIAGFGRHAAYSASKAGLEMLTRTMTAEWAGRGIRANAVSPIVIMTDMGRRIWDGTPEGEHLVKKVPQGRFAEEREVADVVIFLCSNAASMVNGTVVPVDGGYLSV